MATKYWYLLSGLLVIWSEFSLLTCCKVPQVERELGFGKYPTLLSNPLSTEEEFSCLWQECGFCSLDSSADLVRHVYFHCYHTKLKQWGLQALQNQAELSPCVLDFQSRNLIPDIPDHFLCLWEHCEVVGVEGSWGSLLKMP